ncbi:TOMM system kinase/cyclase fusion protein [Teredinibacter franksiae]|uniref:TOMM system kinase/cyclase fusion protein n=1 Tax=Teredinibacter franksiae TaxID=2761453 RepID=UPI00162939D2|nr:TOMM system kinase/cyclase fusion protein [Teredinibacter franksiae]
MTDILSKFKSSVYTILHKVGEGGFGEVYKAINNNTRQTVAIKFLTLNPDFDDNKRRRYIERFERETLLGSKLQHPHIVRLLDKGKCGDDIIYAVFEFIEGVSLKERLAESGPLAPADAAEVMAQVLDALAHAHDRGVVHRDIKPANIILTETGAKIHAKILDFGIGALVNEARQLDYKSITLTQETLGTPSYTAPEQLRGEPPTPKTDLYVWGLVFIECLTGQPAVSGPSLAAVFQKQLNPENIPLPPAIAGHPIAAILRRSLNKKVHERASSAQELFVAISKLNFSSLVGCLTPQKQNDSSTPYDETSIFGSSPPNSSKVERKQITVLSIILNLTTDIDLPEPDVATALLNDQLSQCVDIAIRYGAAHVGTLGDTLRFYFGYPTSSDNDSRLCARAALDIISQLNNRNSVLQNSQGLRTNAHIGIHSGMLTLFADSIPEGETANIAMALARRAEPNQILCSDVTYQLLTNHIDFDEKGSIQLGVEANATPVFALTGERQSEAYGFLRLNRKNHFYVGRETELNQLHTLNIIGSRKNAYVFGEAGVGKSRLLHEYRASLKGLTQYIGQCLPEYANNALYPILKIVNEKYAIKAVSEPQVILSFQQSLEGASDVTLQSAMPVLCAWFGFSIPQQFAGLPPAQDIKNILFCALSRLLTHKQTTEKSHQTLFILEDLHWADPTTLEFLCFFATHSACSSEKTRLIGTSRTPPNESLQAVFKTTIELTKFGSTEVKAFTNILLDGRNASDGVIAFIENNTDGVPLFIEELVAMLKRRSLVSEINGRIDFTSGSSPIEVPNTLRDLLQDKLDSLKRAKPTAQLAATFGRDFYYDSLLAASEESEESLLNNLEEMVNAELVFKHRKTTLDAYTFKHALVQQSVYQSMIDSRRVLNHQKVANALERLTSTGNKQNTGKIANHYAKGELFSKAVQLGALSAQEQSTRAAHRESIAAGLEVIDWASSLPSRLDQIQAELTTYEIILPPAMAFYGYGSSQVADWSQKINLLVEELKTLAVSDDQNQYEELLKKTRWIKLINMHFSANRVEVIRYGIQCLDSFKNDEKMKMLALGPLGQAYQVEGMFNESIDCFEEAHEIFNRNPSLYQSTHSTYGFDAESSHCIVSLSYLHVGRISDAIKTSEMAIEQSLNKNANAIVIAYNMSALNYFLMRDFQKVIDIRNAYYHKHHDKNNKVLFSIFLDIMYLVASGQLKEAKSTLVDFRNSDTAFATGWYFPMLAREILKSGDIATTREALSIIELSFETSTKSNEHGAMPLIYHALGETEYQLAQLTGQLHASQQLTSIYLKLNKAISIAKEQGASYFENESQGLLQRIESETKKSPVTVLA